MRDINTDEYKDLVLYTIAKNSVLYAEGRPGIGKSAIVAEIAKNSGRRLIDIRASLIGEGDLLTKIATEDRSSLVEVVSDILPREENTILLFDEFRHAHEDIRRMFYQIILDRRLGSKYKLPNNTAIIVLSNNTSDVNTAELENALYDRMTIRVNIKENFDKWKEYAYEKGIREEIIAYLELFKEHFIMDGEDERLEMTPRRWEMVSNHWEKRQYVMSDIMSNMFEEFLESVMTFKDLDKYLDGKKEMKNDLDTHYKISTAILMSGDKKLYKKVIENKTPFKAEVDIFILIGSIRKLTGETDLLKGFTKLDSNLRRIILRDRLPQYNWMFKE